MHYLPTILTPVGYVFVNTKAPSVTLVSTETSLKPIVRSKQSTREALANRDNGIWLDEVGDDEYMLTSLP